MSKKKKETFEIEVIRIGYSSKVITVKATDAKEARKLAMKQAPSESFSEHDAEYKIEK